MDERGEKESETRAADPDNALDIHATRSIFSPPPLKVFTTSISSLLIFLINPNLQIKMVIVVEAQHWRHWYGWSSFNQTI